MIRHRKARKIIFLLITIPLATYLLTRVLSNERFIEKFHIQLKLSFFPKTTTILLSNEHMTKNTTATTTTTRKATTTKPKVKITKPKVKTKIETKRKPKAQTVRKTRPKRVDDCKRITASGLSKVKTTKYGIPLILHQIYKDHMLPKQYVSLVKGCRKVNPDFMHLLWTDDMMHNFVDTHYPQYKSLLAEYVPVVSHADFFRVLLLYHFGGVYIDMDVECQKSLSKELDQFKSSAILDQERWLQTRVLWTRNFTAMNSAMMSRKGHPFFKYMLDRFSRLLKYRHFMWRTGPFALHRAYVEYQAQNVSNLNDRVFLAPPTAFSPLLDYRLANIFRMRCGRDKKGMSKFIRIGCEEWFKKHKGRVETDPKMVRQAILVHRFLHLVYAENAGERRRRQNICKTEPSIHKFVV